MILSLLQGVWGKGYAVGFLMPVLLAVLFQVGDACTNTDVITGLVEFEGELYAFDLTDNGALSSMFPNPLGLRENLNARYVPESNSWERLLDVRDAVIETAVQGVDLPVTACVPNDPATCYRIEGDDRVLVSEDGGESWDTAWRLPFGRALFMNRVARICKGRADTRLFDLAVLEREDGYQVVAAFGNEGVVTRQTDGSWERQAVVNARPTPYRATTLLEVLVTIPAELGGWLLFVVIYGIGQYIFFLRRLRHIFLPMTTAVLILLLGGIYLASHTLRTGLFSEWGLFLLVTVAYLVPIYMAYRRWKGESYKLDDPEKGERAAWYWLWSTVGLYFGGIVLLSLWPLGLVPFYGLMVALVLGLAVGVAWWGSSRISVVMDEAGRWR